MRKKSERRDALLCLQACIIEGMRMLGERTGGGLGWVGVHKEEIQLNYTRIECIFNHNASFPDVTVILCERL